MRAQENLKIQRNFEISAKFHPFPSEITKEISPLSRRNKGQPQPMPETKTKIAEMTKAERMGVGLRFTTKFSLLSRLMAISEYDKKRFILTESRPLGVLAACPFAGEQGCQFEMRAAFRAAERFNSYRDLTFEDKELSVARGKTLPGITEDPSPISKKKPPISE